MSDVFGVIMLVFGLMGIGFYFGWDYGEKQEKLRAKAEREAQNGENLSD